MIERYSAVSSIKRKEKLYKDLIDYFGSEYKDIISPYVSQSDQYFDQNLLYQEVLQSIISSLSQQIPENRNPLTEYRRATLKPSQSSEVAQSHGLNSPSSQSRSNNSLSSNYRESFEKFQNARSRIEKSFELNNKAGFNFKPSLIIQSKEDELRAILAAKEREDQRKQVDYSRVQDRILAEREVMDYQQQQIKEKNELRQRVKKDSRAYGEMIGDRERMMRQIFIDDQERFLKEQAEYKKALLRQIEEKQKERMLIKSIDDRMKQYITPEPSSPNSPLVGYGRTNSPYTPSNKAKFLAQYGNLILSKK